MDDLLAPCLRVAQSGDHLHKEANLPGGRVGRTLQDLDGEVSSKGHKLASHETVTPLIA